MARFRSLTANHGEIAVTTIHVTTKREGDRFLVSWMTANQAGIIPVHVDIETEDERILAEMAGLRHLLIEKEVLGMARTGEGLTINVSCGAIRKLLQRKSSKKELVKYSTWMRSRFADAIVKAPKKSISPNQVEARMKEQGKVMSDPIVINEDYESRDTIPTTLGQVCISHHAVYRLEERLGMKNSSAAWRLIRKTLQTDNLTPAELPESVRNKKRRKYCDDAVYFNSSSGWQLVLVESGSILVLTTIYKIPATSYCRAA
ncbi:hypothetical protein [Marinobacter sp. P4B1]|uniref:hypothetical protein n=1 Tax=Marinobacter sp. P4B1 TaxID=1119533 RepID=UPI00072C313B|nr:hypothetical protein [Marinobacter sp. P4B1]KRW83765.1 hypothetical protein AQ621_17090 [Marinobacter sp. P4B1]